LGWEEVSLSAAGCGSGIVIDNDPMWRDVRLSGFGLFKSNHNRTVPQN
jgi:hypothetical protein